MHIIAPAYILSPIHIITNKAIAFDETIQKIDTFQNLKKRYPNATVIEAENSALLPTFANPHVHLEFSANQATLSYGDFLVWLRSVIRHRDTLLPRCDEVCLKKAIDTIIRTGTSTIGQISSYGEELKACANSPLQVYFFNEVIGSNAATADVMYASFMERFYASKKLESKHFKAGVAIHSPYSVHYALAKRALETAKKEECLVSVHFMESEAERQWLDLGTGEFAKFFKEFLGQSTPINRAREFLELFSDTKTLFVHMVWANEEELALIKNYQSSIIHCPISNRLLGNGVLNLEKIKDFVYTIATDGLSSNYSLNMYEELRAALFVHPHLPAPAFAKELIVRATKTAHEILEFDGGIVEENAPASFQLVAIPKDLQNLDEMYLQILLHTQKPQKVYIQGREYV